MSDIKLTRLVKSYPGGGAAAVSGIDLQVREGEFFSLLGPSGCGKSTTLRMIAGFVAPTSGSITLGGEDVTHLPPERRNIGIVFQNYAIFPHMSVAENIAFGLRLRKRGRDEIAAKVEAALRQVGLAGLDDRYQRQLSGGQQQRVALARVLVTEPRILLLDEPLSALDKGLREEMKFWIKDFQKSLGITTVYVTHDQDEALTMSDRIGVMNGGRIVQQGTPDAIYETPSDLFVTRFIGHSNVMDVTVRRRDAAGLVLDLGGQEITAPDAAGAAVGSAAKLVVRPENVLIGEASGRPDSIRVPATVLSETYQGALVRYRLKVAGQDVVAERQNQSHLQRFAPGASVTVSWDPQRSFTLAA
ncbi:ABC transporter ATP-binding protein [Lichenihabitans sp. Uapishka_5]|uniref:ABC transporter ATP-binding protein n=1 Tax=Lichenihabitans sp. Uapishka_5 TaxID=3037302 RepID=UPI0029E7F0FB|nr:ABC transporter ATP-binding protein [Lichenihabitans sp. Uapishka_5]MDX7952552.1 ABC transporter ATP-binding protein [Lichenihabitans sp. Uapishka_5]